MPRAMPKPGETFDRYTIESVLGEGGMGVVYRAFDPRLDRHVALKVVRSDKRDAEEEAAGTGAAEATARLLREARAAAALGHPNAVAIFDLGEVEGEAFIAMELVSGRTLRAFVGQTLVPITTRLRWLYDIARVLAAAHRAGLVHRDVKPENVMVRDDGDIKVLDFGIARRFHIDASPPSERLEGRPVAGGSLTLGTPLYMAPEQLRGAAIDGRTDQFAWGVVAYELLTGRVPWTPGATEQDTLARIVNDEPPPLAASAPDLPRVVVDVVARALQKDPAARFPAMESLVSLLEPVLGMSTGKVVYRLPQASGPMHPFLRTVTTGDASYAPQATTGVVLRPTRRARIAAAALAAGAVLLLAALVIRVRSPRTAAPVSSNAPQAAAASAYAMAIQALHKGMSRVAADLLKQVITVEPSFAPAILRLALLDYGSNLSMTEARDLLQRATVMRASLNDPDRALLDALSPCVLHYDMANRECEERLRAAAEKYPGDLEILRALAGQESFADEIEPAIATCRQALATDPSAAYFSALMGELQAYAGRPDEALATFTECTRMSPEATGCLDFRIALHVQRGECAAVESDARDWIAAAPHDGGRWGPQHYLADAQITLGRPLEAVRETLAQEWSKTPDDERATTKAVDSAMLAVFLGDFRAAEERIGELDALAVADDSEETHAVPASLRVQLLDEEGRFAEMGDVAEAFVRRKESWTRDTREDDWEIARDVTLRMDDALMRAGKIGAPAFVARRDAWRRRWDRTRVARYDWFQAYPYWVTTPAAAHEALAAIPDGGLPAYRPFVYAEAAMGHVESLAGDTDAAIAHLRQAAAGCYALEDPFTAVRSHLWLGEALEKKKDAGGACDAYAFVTAHWGAEPRSVSAAEAKRRSAKLGCK